MYVIVIINSIRYTKWYIYYFNNDFTVVNLLLNPQYFHNIPHQECVLNLPNFGRYFYNIFEKIFNLNLKLYVLDSTFVLKCNLNTNINLFVYFYLTELQLVNNQYTKLIYM